jgi:hypothetical protein
MNHKIILYNIIIAIVVLILWQISRLIYTNYGDSILALASNTIHLPWIWPRNDHNSSSKVCEHVTLVAICIEKLVTCFRLIRILRLFVIWLTLMRLKGVLLMLTCLGKFWSRVKRLSLLIDKLVVILNVLLTWFDYYFY